MSTPRDILLSPADQALKAASDALVSAAGGPEKVLRYTGRGRSQISDWCNPNTRVFMPADAIARLVGVTHGMPGQLDLLRLIAEDAGQLLVSQPAGDGIDEPLPVHLSRIASEAADVIRALANPVAQARGLDQRTRDQLLTELRQLRDASAELINELDPHDPVVPFGRPSTGSG